MTGEEAYWHACTGTPIDAAPALVRIPEILSVSYDDHESRYRVVFEDGVCLKLERVDVDAARSSDSFGNRAFVKLVEQRYLEQRGDKL